MKSYPDCKVCGGAGRVPVPGVTDPVLGQAMNPCPTCSKRWYIEEEEAEARIDAMVARQDKGLRKPVQKAKERAFWIAILCLSVLHIIRCIEILLR